MNLVNDGDTTHINRRRMRIIGSWQVDLGNTHHLLHNGYTRGGLELITINETHANKSMVLSSEAKNLVDDGMILYTYQQRRRITCNGQ